MGRGGEGEGARGLWLTIGTRPIIARAALRASSRSLAALTARANASLALARFFRRHIWITSAALKSFRRSRRTTSPAPRAERSTGVNGSPGGDGKARYLAHASKQGRSSQRRSSALTRSLAAKRRHTRWRRHMGLRQGRARGGG